MLFKNLLFFAGVLFWGFPLFADLESCRREVAKLVAQGPRVKSLRSRLAEIEAAKAQGSLLDIQEATSTQEIAEHNLETKAALRDPLVGSSRGRQRALSFKEADFFVKRMAQHPVNGTTQEKKYDPEECFGFCFGRASLIHHEAIRRSVDPEAIKKIWAVGSLEDEKWHFHVATLFKARGHGTWWVTDNIYRSAINVGTWIQRMEHSSDTDRTMFFVTDPRRFSVYDPRFYTGIDLFGDGNTDFYNGYFRDYFEYAVRKK